MKLNWFSPLPPARSGIARFTAQLLPRLAERFDVTLWTDQAAWDTELAAHATVRSYTPADVPFRLLNNAEITVYNMGNDYAFHGGLFAVSQSYPGIVILHDLSLHAFIEHVFRLGRNQDRSGYLAYVEAQYGAAGRLDAEANWEGTRSINHMSEHYPMTEFVIEDALGVFVHSKANAALLAEKGRWPVACAPLPYAGTTRPHRAQPDRRREPPYHAIIFGYMGPNRRLDAVLQALAALPERDAFRLDVFGEMRDREAIGDQIRALDVEHLVTLHGFVTDEALDEALAASDLAINLRYPSVGEASLSQLLIWDHALPSLVTPVGVYAEFPPEAVCFVRPEHEVADIQSHLRAFLADPGRFAMMGDYGKRTLKEQHAPEAYIQALEGFLCRTRQFQPIAAARGVAERAGAELGAWIDPDQLQDVYRRVAEEVYGLASAQRLAKPVVPRTAVAGPLDQTACRAEVTWIDPQPVLQADSFKRIRVRVKNLSAWTWPALGIDDGTFQLNLGNHWLDEQGAAVIPDDGRTSLPRDLSPQEEIELSLAIRTPKQPGRYMLELDLLQNEVTWFTHQGSRTDRVRVQVHAQVPSRLPETGKRTALVAQNAAVEPLPAQGYRAQIIWLRPESLSAGGEANILVHVRNTSEVTWPALGMDGNRYQINLASRWIDEQRHACGEEGRAALPHDLKPGDEMVLSLRVQAPHHPGRYSLELDMVQEGVTWFQDQGSEPDRVSVHIEDAPANDALAMEISA